LANTTVERRHSASATAIATADECDASDNNHRDESGGGRRDRDALS
jgi:hypothetical protein